MAGIGASAKALTPQTGQALMSALQSQNSPVNKNTADLRTDPQETVYLDQNRIRKALDRALENALDGDPVRVVYAAMRSCMQRILEGVAPPLAAQQMAQQLLPPPMPGAMGAPAGPMGQPAPGGPPQGGPPQATAGPPQGMPVSPPSPGG